MGRELPDYFVVRILETANRCRDLPTQRELMQLADELAEVASRFGRPNGSDHHRAGSAARLSK